MVYQRYSRRARERGSTRCLHCGYGCGQFAVQYYEDGFGRGYCSLDCYTSAKVTGRNLQTQQNQQQQRQQQQYRRGGGGARGYGCGYGYDPQPQPWPTGLMVEAPPSPKPWRGRSLSQSNMSWRTGSSASTSNLSSASGDDSSSSQQSSVEADVDSDWQAGAESEDGDNSVGSGNDANGGAAAAADGRQAALAPGLPEGINGFNGNRRRQDGESGNVSDGYGGGGHALGNGVRGGASAFGAGTAGHNMSGNGGAGGVAGFEGNPYPPAPSGTGFGVAPGLYGNDKGDASAARGELAHLPPLAPVPLVPLAPIPRMGAFPAQRRVHGTVGAGGGGRRVPVRTVAFAFPPARVSPPPRLPGGAGAAAAAAGSEERLPAGAACADAFERRHEQARADMVAAGLIPEEDEEAKGVEVSTATSTVGAAGRREPAASCAADAAVGAGTGVLPRRGDRRGDGENGAVGGVGPASAAAGSTAEVGGAVCVAKAMEGCDDEAAAESEGEGECEQSDAAANAGTLAIKALFENGWLSSCGLAPPARRTTVAPTKVAVRQWRRLFLP